MHKLNTGRARSTHAWSMCSKRPEPNRVERFLPQRRGNMICEFECLLSLV